MPCADVSELHFRGDTYDALLNTFLNNESEESKKFLKLEKSYALFAYPYDWDKENDRTIYPAEEDSPFREQYPNRWEDLYSVTENYDFRRNFFDEFALRLDISYIRNSYRSKGFVCFCIYEDLNISSEGDFPNIAKELKRFLKPFGTTEFYLALQQLGKVCYKDLNYK